MPLCVEHRGDHLFHHLLLGKPSGLLALLWRPL
jgi:hypothetical protein